MGLGTNSGLDLNIHLAAQNGQNYKMMDSLQKVLVKKADISADFSSLHCIIPLIKMHN